ncbi:MAG: polynucleotide kinase-phosphatase [Myxococcales bacterium]|nr:polynucleotide kinase-phosphatase [Myxococcales bacterium]
MSHEVVVPELSLVVLVGASGSGKSTFARAHFLPTEVVSSDACRGLVSDNENDQSATADAFDLVHFIARKRLAAGRLTVIDATNVQSESRTPLVALAREHHCIPVAIVFQLSERLCLERNAQRSDRAISAHAVRQQVQQLRRSLRDLKLQGFRHIYVFDSPEQVAAATVRRQPLWSNRRDEHGPFDIIGDIHGCYDELTTLLRKLGYLIEEQRDGAASLHCQHPQGRKAVFLGDLIDRGPKIVEVLRLVMAMVAQGSALCVPGNHEAKLLRKLRGKDVKPTHGLQATLDQLGTADASFVAQVEQFIDGLVSHYVLDDGKLVVAHAGLKQALQGRGSGAVREFCLYGETSGEIDEYGLPVRLNWASEYRGRATVVYGHTPVPVPEWVNNTLCIDTGCVFGGALSALRYPEREIVQVDAAREYYAPIKPLASAESALRRAAMARPDDVLDADDVLGKRQIETRILPTITVQAENAAAALELMSRFAVDPRWLIYLPPTMSPCETAKSGPYLEHPRDALAHYREQGVSTVICEEKHMGSRAVIVLCRDRETAQRRFRATGDELGVCYTRTGRPFFSDAERSSQLLLRVHAALERSGLWDALNTRWICLDVELLPWSAKAQELLRRQYAATASAALTSLSATLERLHATATEGAAALSEHMARRLRNIEDYRASYRRYCWSTRELADFRVAPFHLLASEGAVHSARDHVWHMQTLAKLAEADPSFFWATPYQIVDLSKASDEEAAIAWWEQRTAAGGEGMVVKPLDWIVRGKRGLVQPAVKCRGREYLRIIYGPEYTAPENLDRLRPRGLSVKRGLALREFALGLESLHRFVEEVPLYRVHECVFAVLALESEPVDPRL